MRTSGTPLAFALILLLGRSAGADPGTQVFDCPSSPACQSLFQLAREQSGQGNLSEAARLYKAAYEIRADPVLLFNIARVFHKQGQLQEAAAYYRQFLNSPSEDAEQKRKAQDYLNQITSLENLPPPVPPVQTTIAALSPKPNATSVVAQPQSLPESPIVSAKLDARAASTPEERSHYRARWLLGFGVPLAASGLTVLGLGIAALVVDGSCAQTVPGPIASECNQKYNSGTVGLALTIGGVALLTGGIGLLAAGGKGYGRRGHAGLTGPFAGAPTSGVDAGGIK